MKFKKLIVSTENQKYPILIGTNLSSKLSHITKTNSLKFKKCLLVIDQQIPNKMILKIKRSLQNKKIYTYYFKATEINKNTSSVNKILNILLNKNFSRQDCLISIGGGITGDVSGFAASLYKRGLYFINIPTTLLSQVDSSVGGKTGINTKQGKNLIGSFYQPKLVISDINFLKSLPKREIICGYGEMLKHSLINSKVYYKYLSKNFNDILKLKSPFIEKAIFESCKIKKNVVEKDEKENNYRKILNFGHTFAHAFEATNKLSKNINHGEAVLLGMMCALEFAYLNKILKHSDLKLIKTHYKKLNLQMDIKNYFKNKNIRQIIEFMKSDKKNFNKNINLVLLKKIGLKPIINSYSTKKVEKFLTKKLN